MRVLLLFSTGTGQSDEDAIASITRSFTVEGFNITFALAIDIYLIGRTRRFLRLFSSGAGH